MMNREMLNNDADEPFYVENLPLPNLQYGEKLNEVARHGMPQCCLMQEQRARCVGRHVFSRCNTARSATAVSTVCDLPAAAEYG
jgi:hypothetical protein